MWNEFKEIEFNQGKCIVSTLIMGVKLDRIVKKVWKNAWAWKYWKKWAN